MAKAQLGTSGASSRSGVMIYAVVAASVIAMLCFMFWRTAFAMRRDRVLNQRDATRGRHAFTRMHRARFLLSHAFRPADEPDWQADLRERLNRP